MHPGVTEHEQAATFSVAKADGEAPVAAYLAAMPGWKSPASTRSSAVRSQPAQGGQVELALRRNRGPGLVPRLPWLDEVRRCRRHRQGLNLHKAVKWPGAWSGARGESKILTKPNVISWSDSETVMQTRGVGLKCWTGDTSSDGRATTTMKKATTTGKPRKNGRRRKRRPSLSADRCENQGAARLAGRHARSDPNSHQAGRPRGCRGVEVERGPGVVARRNNLHR